MFLLKVFVALALAVFCQAQNDYSLTTPELLESWGYKAEVHHVTTEDGYILALHRIPPVNSTDKVVILVPGVVSSSADFVVLGPGKAISLLLSDAGYDVWLANPRGNFYSRSHITLSPDEPAFWNFSWHELGIYDLPASIDYILNKTQQEQLYYIGHSQGTTSYFVMGSQRPEYNEKIRLQFSMAAVYDLSQTTNPLLKIVGLIWNEAVNDVANALPQFEVFPHTNLSTDVIAPFCETDGQVCQDLLYLLSGYSPYEANITLMPEVWAHYPAGASSKEIIHFFQIAHSGQFRQYDYGLTENLARYGSETPPVYNVSRITTHMYIFWASNDQLATQGGVDHLYANLDDSKTLIHVNDTDFNHGDFIWGSHADTLIYNQILAILSNDNSSDN